MARTTGMNGTCFVENYVTEIFYSSRIEVTIQQVA